MLLVAGRLIADIAMGRGVITTPVTLGGGGSLGGGFSIGLGGGIATLALVEGGGNVELGPGFG